MTASIATMVEDEYLPRFPPAVDSSMIREVTLMPDRYRYGGSTWEFAKRPIPVSVETMAESVVDMGMVFAADLPEVDVRTVAIPDWIRDLDVAQDQQELLVQAALSDWIQELDAICREAATRDWDGEGALPVQEGAHRHAVTFVTELDADAPFPEVSVDPDGELSLSWYVGNAVFSVSINQAGRLSYAGLLGASDCHGTEWMVDQVPTEVIRQLARLLSAHGTSGRPD